MDYTGMSQRDLVAACAARGLPTYGSKATLRSRLAATPVSPDVGVVSAVAVPQTPPPPPAPAPPVVRGGVVVVAVPQVGDLDAQRVAARAAAAAAGHTPAGRGAYTARHVGPGRFEVPVR